MTDLEGKVSPMMPKKKGVIEEAIHQYDNKSETNHSINSYIPTPQNKVATAITRVQKALGTPNIANFQQSYSRTISMGYLNEKVNDITNSQLDITQHTVTFPNSNSKPIEIPSTLSGSWQSINNHMGLVSDI